MALLFAMAGAALFIKNHRDLHAIDKIELKSIHELEATRANSGAGRSFRQMCGVTGVVQQRNGYQLTSHLGQVECVWYCCEVNEIYQTGGGQSMPKSTRRKVFEYRSPAPITLRDEHGSTVEVDLHDTPDDQPEYLNETFNLSEPYPAGADPNAFGMQPRQPATDKTQGYEYKEWVIRADQRLYVLGEARVGAERLEIGKPAKGRFIVSTRTQQQVQAERVHERKGNLGCAVVIAIVGVVLIVIGISTG